MAPPCWGGVNEPYLLNGENTVCPHIWFVVRGFGLIVEGMEVLGYLSHSEGVSCSTSSHMLGSWFFPSFLLRDGSLIWMYIASFMVLMTACTSLFFMVKHS